jgi:hypothetical protein
MTGRALLLTPWSGHVWGARPRARQLVGNCLMRRPSVGVVVALTTVVKEMLKDLRQVPEMGRHAAAWANHGFGPERYASSAVARLP